ncbi:glycine-rich RNA-binding protein 3, mitochondrial-like isoform X2 [Punica granatum]|uniref:Glycine-rich RNA-binding protein 3, mitochondrial-like isoform X2 n=2 Tax=Punica granatum TaxID=22663 RepID=A0A6P8DG07_PUNGR|nr:glycine-rich RNA-binding protein 3, mitochondrial-like isoform X2 [Punica granatum]XP_031396227.1 glycine-rich RNA-binding protein 3, mitochondrial-like isoform X2 [Punica granatum]OWM64528.1 hypothetical protein CDL15_Pgr020495 [Punica granatum]PKI32967.1 hypothetical protein CRG98_046641 [Punica granatum]
MAFANRVGNLLKNTASRHANLDVSARSPAMYQAIRSMSSKLFVGGLSYGTDDISLKEAFSGHGEIVEARVIIDRETGRSRGFGFVSFRSSDEASNAMRGMDGQDLHGRRIRVNYAEEKSSRGFGSGSMGFRGGGDYGNDGGYGGSAGGYETNSYAGGN